MRICIRLALLLVWAAPATATDFWVDAVNGSNTNSGTAAADAWRTLTHAFGQVAGGDTLHVLPGTYDAAHGEVFPLRPPLGPLFSSELTVIGEAGPESTIVSGATVFRLEAGAGGVGSIELTVQGLTLVNAVYGFRCTSNNVPGGCVRLTLRDVAFDHCSYAVHFRAINIGGLCHEIDLERVHAKGGFRTIDVDNYDFCDVDVTVKDSTLEGTSGAAIWCRAGIETYDDVDVVRTRIVDCGDGIRAGHSSSGAVNVTVEDSLVAGCGSGVVNDTSVTLRRSTVADNVGVGVEGLWGSVSQSILYGNGQDLGPGSGQSVTLTNVGSGLVPGAGNISVDPLFFDAAGRDYRLGFGTECVDAIGGIGGMDLNGAPRGTDGDLDLVGARDMGALELRTLDMPESLPIGQKLHVDFHAELGTFSALFLARTTQLPVPIATPFGDQWLPPGFIEAVGTRKALSPQGIRRTIVIPDNPALVGQSFSFQALSRSSAAPLGAAWTQARTVLITF